MAKKVQGNLSGLSASQLKSLEKLYTRKIDIEELAPLELAREIYRLADDIGRRIGLLVTREGRIVEVVVGSREILYLPDLGRYRFGRGRLRRLRLLFSDLTKNPEKAHIPSDIFADLEKLRLDAVVSLKETGNRLVASFAHLVPTESDEVAPVHIEEIRDLPMYRTHFGEYMAEVERQLDQEGLTRISSDKPGAVLVGVYPPGGRDPEDSMEELKELARTAGVEVLGTIVQRRTPDPKTLLGKGKLEEVVLRCLRLGAEILVFDTELRPFQWRVITNSTDLKVVDRSMIILDIFALRASSADGRLQVELAQLKYNLPRLVEKDVGLSRLTGGIGGRGPGETKLEIGRRRSRDRIRMLEKRINKLSKQRGVQRSRRIARNIPLLAILGYTNAGKSTLFNALTSSDALAEDKLFATLEPTQRSLFIPGTLIERDEDEPPAADLKAVLADTVGFIRDLPKELQSAFRATLEEIYEADLLLHVVDASDKRVADRIKAVERILEDMELADMPRLLVLNKIDLLSSSERLALENEYGGLSVSATKGEGFSQLLARAYQCLPAELTNPQQESKQVSASQEF